jgi:Holliday junction resolvasome RuvABC ATP-dependent DNA helicase subunit
MFASYGLNVRRPGRYVIDQLVPAELGGSNDQANVWPELAARARQKDRLENRLLTRVCDGAISLARAQKQIARDWLAAYHAAGLKP